MSNVQLFQKLTQIKDTYQNQQGKEVAFFRIREVQDLLINETNKFQKQTNKKLQSFITSTQWKQEFINIMIQYYYKKQIKIPKSILVSIKSRVSLQQNPITSWVSEKLQFNEGQYVMAEHIWQQYLEDSNNKVSKISFNKQVNDFFLQHPDNYNGISYDLIDIRNKDERVKGTI